jgi:hypothetical protein
MTSYATCAYMECTRRIAYEPKEDLTRPRYCEEHEMMMDARLGKRSTFEDLNIKVVRGV